MSGDELREATKIIADLTKAGFTPEEIAVFLDNPYQAYQTELGRIGVLIMLQRGMTERKLVKQIGSTNYYELTQQGLITNIEGSRAIKLTSKGQERVLIYALTREEERKATNG